MLRSMNDLKGYQIQATDGTIGHVKDFYFDDQWWTARYIVVETGSWFSERKVLISPYALGEPNWVDKVLPTSMTMAQVKTSPDIDTNKPVSRQHEMDYLDYYSYPYYWGGASQWGGDMGAGGLMPGFGDFWDYPRIADPERVKEFNRAVRALHDDDDPHLRSCQAVTGYALHARDGVLGHVQGLLVDDANWAIRYLVIDTSNWWMGHKVLIAPQWVEDINWEDTSVSVKLTRQAIKDAPQYDPTKPVERAYETEIYGHFKRDPYWFAPQRALFEMTS
jgi:hypothetical protein